MPADALATFLQQCNTFDFKSAQSDSVTVCMGNEAGDLDSLASAIALAYLSKILEPAKTFLPLYQQGRHDFVLRPENLYALRQAAIDTELILCLDDLPAQKLQSSGCKYALVDHNRLQNQYQDSQEPDRVAVIIDHHQDEGQHLRATPRFLTMDAGSCASLVVDYFADKLGEEQLAQQVPQSLAALLQGAILIDTGNLRPTPQGKATDRDQRAFALLSNSATGFVASRQASSSPEDYFTRLREAKSDISSLSLRDQFRRDYKHFTTSNGFTIGLSTVLLSADELADKAGWTGFSEALKQWAKERQLDAVGVLTNFRTKQGKPAREVLLLAPTSALQGTLIGLGEVTEHGVPDLQLVPWSSNEPSQVGIAAFKQKNEKATRKQVLPALRSVTETMKEL